MEKFLELFGTFVRNHTNVSSNIQDKFLISAIREALDIDYQEIIGTRLFLKMVELVESDEIKDEGNEKFMELLKYSKYFIAYTTVARLAVISSVKIDNIGLNRTEDEKVKGLDLTDVFSVEDFYYNKADVYKNRLQNYLCQNHKYFSKWLTNSKIDEIKTNLYSAASCNIFLGGPRGKKNIKF